MKHYKNLIVDEKTVSLLTDYLHYEPEHDYDCLDEDEVYSYTAGFDDGREIEVRVCGVKYREGKSNLAYAEAVFLDRNGEEICRSEHEDEFLGEWKMYDEDDNEYIVNVKAG